VMAALLGADEFAFGTSVLVALGCDMARQCHLNTCPTGIATQKPELRAKFRGKPEHVVRFFEELAGEVQQLLAKLGLPSLCAATGRADLLEPVFRDGDIVIVSPAAPVRRGDRVVVRTRKGEVMAKELQRRSARRVELLSLNPAHPSYSFELADVAWLHRIVWASQ